MENNILYNISVFVIGIIILYFGGEGLVKGASRLARSLGVNSILVGLTVVAFGTSAPELVVSIIASLKGSNDLIVGNILGSNISNIGLILATAALIYSIRIKLTLIKVELPFMIMLSLLLFVLSKDLLIQRSEGVVLFALLTSIIIYSCYDAFKEPKHIEREFDEFLEADKNYFKNSLYIVFGLVGLSVGAKLLVDSAISIAQDLGVSEAIIGISAVAIGTSLPELTTSVIAALKKESGIIIGNIIGSNIFNIGILGIVSVIKPIEIEQSLLNFEFVIMILFSIALLPIMRTGFKITKTEGTLLLLFYLMFLRFIF
ncbi:MAG: calcium/sodium antiporter [Candidatus Dadabacteria bacterium]|nr:calcium/sodium antiporter [Candidatus Dadabacteria bacterium]NIS09554.1 calcium/sodium antiporter [Candidatus Dadabacteria bacterium]NIV43063.1 calcium/sodium antiporter [Candidatus Dadabacteria bacterium]NIX16028.1 calcium/sodium antiporter [Candidatus Dadabacteria bacterium]NIY22731.1 calcium/sodium antiporter [Candidatus Dadabacteria bacterium]